MNLIYRHGIAVFAVAALAACAYPVPSSALAQPASSPIAGMARACHNHAGRVEGDGEYTDGAIQSAVGISCRRALQLVKPRYHWIYKHWEQAYHHGFRIGAFRCHITPDGPNDLKSCVHRNKRFAFV